MRVLLLFVGTGLLCSLLVFSFGFLLTRQELALFSHDEASAPLFGRIVLVVVDALRYDFAKNMPFVRELEQRNDSRFFISEFWSDAPTTTAQRLKGLTTGSLPTFIDVSKNFMSENIEEDNWIDQLVRSGANLTFMGDDTWEQLFKGRFRRSFPYPSFNVRDLHTVDNGVLEHLFPELKRRDWTVLIAHFLGVDHVGHTYGPDTSYMKSKLQQMNVELKRLVQAIEDDTLLVVIGDHGMTWDGNHGGESDDELSAALMLYSPALDFYNSTRRFRSSEPFRIPQIDLVPSIAVALGIPIPFGNLGKLIPEFFRDDSSYSKHLMSNFEQVQRYLAFYQEEFRLFSGEQWDRLGALQRKVRFSSGGVRETVDYLEEASEACRRAWSRFDVPGMMVGLIGIAVALLLLAGNIEVKLTSILFGCSYGALFTMILLAILGQNVSFGYGLLLGALTSHVPAVAVWNMRVDLKGTLFVGVHCVSLFSVRCLENERVWNQWMTFGMLIVLTVTEQRWTHILLLVALNFPSLVALANSPVLELGLSVVLCFVVNRKYRPIFVFVFGYLIADMLRYEGFATRVVAPHMVYFLTLSHFAWYRDRQVFCCLLVLLNGSKYALVCVTFVLVLQQIKHIAPRVQPNQVLDNWSVALVFLAFWCFYETGHLSAFSSIRFDSGFIGFQSATSYVLTGLLIVINTFGSFVLVMLSFPERAKQLRFLFSLFYFCTSIFVFVSRRHLMVWRVFAPKYIFDALITIQIWIF